MSRRPLVPPGPLADPVARRKEWRAWYFYDWANSAFVTTVGTVLLGPYLTSVAERAACGFVGTPDDPCVGTLSVLGIPVAAGSLSSYTVTFATLLSAVLLPVVGAVADRTSRKRLMLLGFAWTGAAAATLLVLTGGSAWQPIVVLMMVASICLGSSIVVYDSILNDISAEDDRDAVSSRGWALGYLGGGLLLAANLVLLNAAESIGLTTEQAAQISFASAGVWWAAWTLVPFLGLHDRPPVNVEQVPGGLLGASFTQLLDTLRDLRHYPQTLLFLVAYLFYNDGIQTVIASAAVFGSRELGLGNSSLVLAILVVQFVAFFGALAFGRLARRVGAKHTILGSLVVWAGVSIAAYFLPAEELLPFLGLSVAIGIVLGGSQALSRSLYSTLVPRGREAEYFGLYQAAERGTSWFGTLTFGLVFQFTGSYRLSVVALMVFFVVGFVLLSRLDVPRAIREAGNEVPAVV
jgi:UMF1 family MFS transporter